METRKGEKSGNKERREEGEEQTRRGERERQLTCRDNSDVKMVLCIIDNNKVTTKYKILTTDNNNTHDDTVGGISS